MKTSCLIDRLSKRVGLELTSRTSHHFFSNTSGPLSPFDLIPSTTKIRGIDQHQLSRLLIIDITPQGGLCNSVRKYQSSDEKLMQSQCYNNKQCLRKLPYKQNDFG